MGRTAAALVLVTVALTGCRETRGNDVAASVDGTSVSRDELEDLVRALAANPEVFGIEEDLATGTVAGDVGRDVLSALVGNVASANYLAAQGVAVADTERQEILDGFGAQAEGVPAVVLDLEVDRRASSQAIGRQAGASGAAQAAWDASPAEVGLLCVRQILVETEEEALDVLAELEGGADFAELAAERSTDPSAAASGGAIEISPDEPCIGLVEAQSGLDPVFLAAAVEASPGTPVGPIETSFGWHVILARPYDEVAVAVDPAVGETLLEDYLATVDVDVDPRYGRWDPESASVVALDAAPPTTFEL